MYDQFLRYEQKTWFDTNIKHSENIRFHQLGTSKNDPLIEKYFQCITHYLMLWHCCWNQWTTGNSLKGFTLDFANYTSIWFLKNYYLCFYCSKKYPLRSYKKCFYSIIYKNTNENSFIHSFICSRDTDVVLTVSQLLGHTEKTEC